jgi:cytochrome c oxidase cbb3-type subunit 3
MSTNEESKINEPEEIDEVTKVRYLGGDDYDGIKELDNKLPPWLMYIFYITIVFSAAYLIALWVFDNKNLKQEAEYAGTMQIAEEKKVELNIKIIDESNISIVTDATALTEGKQTYDKICAVCHGKFGEGLVGPNFTDEYHIHGGTIQDMYKIVITGVLDKGMLSYKNQLTGEQIQNVLSYIISLEGTNPANQKAPQGEKFVRNK